ncbi:putative MFS family arabinose efflux permease [Paraburkholderia sp. BL27I4N3]|nr:putative MFS family arabinose efflux permease [Paraburkholderia sp. BL27I4N3]
MMTASGLIGLAIHTPVGAFIDGTHFKRGTIVAGVMTLAISGLAITLFPVFPVVATANAVMAVAGAIFGPAVAAITVGVLGRDGLAAGLGRNAAFDNAGNVFIAVVAGVVGWWFSQSAVFYLVPILAVLAVIPVLSIPVRAIDNARTRGCESARPDRRKQPSSWAVLIGCRPLVVFATCVALFHFANAPMLPLVGQKLALAHAGEETAPMSACIIAAQTVMLPLALLVGAKADRWRRKPIFLAAFAILPIRGFLYPLSDNAFWLVGVQLLDGVGAGIFGALMPVVLADLMRGTGRYNISQGDVATTQDIGASLSNTVAGLIVVKAGYSFAFVTLASVALVGFVVFLLTMPEALRERAPMGGSSVLAVIPGGPRCVAADKQQHMSIVIWGGDAGQR